MADVGAPRINPGLGTKLVYGLGSVAFGTKDAGFATFLLIFYNQVLGISATLVSLAIMIALIADAVFDPIIGEISDNWRSRIGRRHPFMYGAALPVALLYFMLWNPPHWQTPALFFYLLVSAILVRMAIACYEIPSAALAPELSPDYDQRTSLMAFRWMFGSLAAGITLAITFALFMVPTPAQPTGILNRNGYFSYSLMAAGIMMISILISAAGTHSRIKYMKQVPVRHRPTIRELAREMIESLSHRSLMMVTLASLFGGMALGLGSALNTYFGTYFWRFTPQQLSVLGAGFLLAAVIAVPLAPVVSARLDKRRGYVATAFASLFVNNITMTLKYFGLMPPDGSAALLLIFFGTITIGLALAICSGILVSSMIADVVEDSEIRTGRRSEGLFSASLSFVNKATSGLGILIAGALIELVHFPVHASPATIDVVAPHAVRNLVLIYMPLQVTLWIISILMVSGYRIDRATHESNLERLSQSARLAEATPGGMEIAGSSGELEEVLQPHTAAPRARVSRGA